MECEILRILNREDVKVEFHSLLEEIENKCPTDVDPVSRNKVRRVLINQHLSTAAEKVVIPRLSLPHVTTVADIVQAGVANFAFAHEAGFDITYERFSIHAAADTAYRLESEAIQLISFMSESELRDIGPEILWESENGFDLRWRDVPDAELPPFGSVVAVLNGNCTAGAMSAALREIEKVVNTTEASFDEIWLALKRDPVVRTPPPEMDGGLESLFTKSEHEARERREERGYPERVHMNLLRSDLQAYFRVPSKKDLVGNRLRNAVRLLVESDRQTDHGLRLATSFSAIEALVCNKNDGINEMLSLNVATILKSNPDDRLEFKRRIKKLYDLRSRVLHGDYAAITMDDQLQARALAACVMYALVEWQAYSNRCGESGEEAGKFFAQLDDARTAGKRMPGVPDFV